MLKEADKETLLLAAVAAPSADNSQPWQYRWTEDDALDLWIDPKRSGKFSDARYLLSDLALGACIENINIQAQALGYSMKADYFPDGEDSPLWVARLAFTLATPKDSGNDLATIIHQRATNRRFPWKGPIEVSVRQDLITEAAQIPGIRLVWCEHDNARKACIRALWTAESLRFKSRKLHQELFSSIAFAVGRKGSSPEGLSPKNLAVEFLLWPFFKALRHWPLMRALNLFGGAWLMGFRSSVLPAKLSPGLALLCCDEKHRSSIVDLGRALERLWLRATVAGLSLQPYAAPGVLSLGFVELETHWHEQMKVIREDMQQACPDAYGVLMLRLGRAGKAHVSSGERRALSSFEKKE